MNQLQLTELDKQLAEALKFIARRQDIKAYLEQNEQMNRLVRRAAAQYVTGEQRHEAMIAATRLEQLGYAVSLEYIGENTTSEKECELAAQELSDLIAELGAFRRSGRVSFDLSHIGLLLDTELALAYLLQLAAQAKPLGIELFISMEESAKTDRILQVYEQAVALHLNIGITLQAHLHRTWEDVTAKLPAQARVRIVKGAYQEDEEICLPRSQALNERYLELLTHVVTQGHQVSIATHDEALIEVILQKGLLDRQGVEFEMLYGIQPELSARLQAAGHPVRIYLTYGQEWYLYLCHRIAEYPPNLYRAVIHMIQEEPIDAIASYGELPAR